jgi:sulfate transport system permease protein
MTKLEQYDYPGAAAIAVVLLVISFLLLVAINLQSARARDAGGAA